MSYAMYPALFFTVAMLVTTAYFLMGGLPLLILKHDTPVDAGFVRGFFNVYYKAAIGTALGACASYALWGRFGFAIGAAALLLLAFVLRRKLLSAMEHFGTRMQDAGEGAIRGFRRVHLLALSANVVQLAVLVWGTTQLSL